MGDEGSEGEGRWGTREVRGRGGEGYEGEGRWGT